MENIFSRQKGRRLGLALAMAASSLVPVVAATSHAASAATPITVIAPTLKKSYSTYRNEWLPSFEVTNKTTFPLAVAITFSKAPRGTTFTVNRHAGLTLKYGYPSWSHVSKVAFTGNAADVNKALANLKLHTRDAGKVTIKVSATSDDTRLSYEPITSHYYGFVAAPAVKWTDALTAAAGSTFRGMSGHLVTISSAVENDFVSSNIEDASNVWIAATDDGHEGDFQWAAGPENGQTFWKARCAVATGADSCTGANSVDSRGTYKTTNIDNPLVDTYSSWDRTIGQWGQNYEPNNWSGPNAVGGAENYAATNWSGTFGKWNDLPNSTSSISGYVVEYEGPRGKPYTGVVEATASYNVVKSPSVSAFAPRSVKLTKGALPGSVVVTWSKPNGKIVNPMSELAGYNIVRARGDSLIVNSCTVRVSNPLTCTLNGFGPLEDIDVTVSAIYSRTPTEVTSSHAGQRSFGRGVLMDPLNFQTYVELSTPIKTVVRSGAKVLINGTGLQAGSRYTVTTGDNVLVAAGTVPSNGSLSNVSFAFPFAAFKRWAELASEIRSVATYKFAGTNAAGVAVQASTSVLFSGMNYVATAYNDPVLASSGLYGAIPHTAIPG